MVYFIFDVLVCQETSDIQSKLLNKKTKAATQVQEEEEVTDEPVNVSYTNDAGEEESFDFINGKSYKSGDDIFKITNIDFDKTDFYFNNSKNATMFSLRWL